MNAAPDGYCPICLEGPWRAIGKHTAQIHGLTAAQVRERFGISRARWHEMNQAGKRGKDE